MLIKLPIGSLDEFSKKRFEFDQFTQKLKQLLHDLLAAKKLEYHLIEARTKSVSSFDEKISRSSKAYFDLSEVSDICGLRIITYYQDHSDFISKLIQEEFCVDEEKSLIHSSVGAEFGYRSSHFVVRLNILRTELPEWADQAKFCAEIQVRTVLQHAWAAISHKLQYKREEDVPLALKRKLFRLSALFELADDEFVSLRDASGVVKEQISIQISAGQRRIPLDVVSLGELLNSSPSVAELCAAAEEVGFSFEPLNDANTGVYERDEFSDTLQLAMIAKLETVDQFDVMLVESLSWAKKYLDTLCSENRHARVGAWHATPGFICQLILIRYGIDSIRIGNLLKCGYERSIATSVFGVARDFVI